MGRQDDLHPVVDIEDFWMVIHLFGYQGDAREKAPGLGEIAEVIALTDRISIVDLAPAVQCRERRVSRRADEPFDHAALLVLLASASAQRRASGQAGMSR
jgi:hypothetical protein